MFKKIFNFTLLLILALGSSMAQVGKAAPFSPQKTVLAWEQAYADGFGAPSNDTVGSLVEYKGRVYAGTRNDLGGQVWRKELGGSWGQFMSSGLGDTHNTAISALSVVGDNLYMGTANSTSGAEVWKTDGTNSEQINSDGFGDVHNETAWTITGREVWHFDDFISYVQVGTQNTNTGAQLWETDQTVWFTGTLNGFNDPNNTVVSSGCVPFENYFGTTNEISGTQIIAYDLSYGTWTPFKDGGFGNLNNWSASSIICLDDYVLVGTYNEIDGAEIWRYDYNSDSWSAVVSGGFNDTNNIDISSMVAVGEYLYAGTENAVSGGEVWRSLMHGDAGSWEQVNLDGFGDLNNSAVTTLAGAGRYLYAGTRNITSGAELWQVELNGPDSSFLVKDDGWYHYFRAAYNSQEKQYLVMWENLNDGNYDDTLQAQRIGGFGSQIGAPFMVSSGGSPAQERTCPRLAYDSLHNRYLAVWTFEVYTHKGVRARLVSATGGLVGDETIVDDYGYYLYSCPEAGYSPTSDRYLIVYAEETYPDLYDIHAKALLPDGTLDGSDVLVAQDVAYIDDLGLAYNAARDEFLMVWNGDSESNIYGRRIKLSGGLAAEGAVFSISEVADGHTDQNPAVGVVATGNGVGEYLVVWQAHSDYFHNELKAQRVTGLGVLDGTTTILCDNDTFLCSRPAVSGIGNQRFEVIWTAGEPERYGAGIYGVTMGADGSLSSTRTWLTGDKRGGSVTIHPGLGNTALVLYSDYPPDWVHWNLRGYILDLVSNWAYLPMMLK
jgi:hypothetical protein